jgi:multisubunit Na+/H+ antiporter MnhC subunit
MTPETAQLVRISIVFIPLLFIIGLYCIIATHNLIRTLIGMEILTKAVTLLIILAGYVSGRTALAQSFAITLIVIEVVVMVVAAGIIVNVHRHNGSLDVRKLTNLKG